MSKRQKLVERFRRNPKNVRFAEMDSLLLALGFEKRQRGSSHAIYTLGPHRLTIPFRTPFILSYCVQQILQVIDDLDDLFD